MSYRWLEHPATEEFPDPHFRFSAFRRHCEENGVKVREVEFEFADWLWENGAL